MMPTHLQKGIGTTMLDDVVQSFKAIARGEDPSWTRLSTIKASVGLAIGVMALSITAGFVVDALKGALRKDTRK